MLLHLHSHVWPIRVECPNAWSTSRPYASGFGPTAYSLCSGLQGELYMCGAFVIAKLKLSETLCLL